MRAITMYEANDGSRWDSEADALKREALNAEVAELTNDLVEPPAGTNYANGEGFVQQPSGARDRLLAFLRAKGAHRDIGGPIGKLMYRVRCIDEYDRQWGQPYFAINPDKAKSQREVGVR